MIHVADVREGHPLSVLQREDPVISSTAHFANVHFVLDQYFVGAPSKRYRTVLLSDC